MTETELSRKITEALETIGCMVIRVQSGSLQMRGRRIRAAKAGTPDLCVLVPGGRTVWLEVKTDTGKLSDVQKRTHDRMRAMGHVVSVVRSVEFALSACV